MVQLTLTVSELRTYVSEKGSIRQHVDRTWRVAVIARLAELDWSRADLARESRVAKSTITTLLDGTTNYCDRIPQIHKALGWPANTPTEGDDAANQIVGMLQSLTDFERGEVLGRVRTLYEKHQEQLAREQAARDEADLDDRRKQLREVADAARSAKKKRVVTIDSDAPTATRRKAR